MRKALFQIENDPVFKGYSDGSKWNGFANPYFDLQTAKTVLAYYQNQPCIESRESWLEWELNPTNVDGKELYSFGFGYAWHQLEGDDLLTNLFGDWAEIEGEEVASAYEMLCSLKEDDKNRKYKFDWLHAFINLWNVEEERGKN